MPVNTSDDIPYLKISFAHSDTSKYESAHSQKFSSKISAISFVVSTFNLLDYFQYGTRFVGDFCQAHQPAVVETVRCGVRRVARAVRIEALRQRTYLRCRPTEGGVIGGRILGGRLGKGEHGAWGARAMVDAMPALPAAR